MIFNNKRIRSLEEKVEELEITLDKVLKAIESESFLEDFEKFQKFNQLKNIIPTLEIYMSLKQLIIEMDLYRESVNHYRDYSNLASSERKMYKKEGFCKGLIDKIRNDLRDKNIDPDEVLLLYGISLDDLENFIKPLIKKRSFFKIINGTTER